MFGGANDYTSNDLYNFKAVFGFDSSSSQFLVKSKFRTETIGDEFFTPIKTHGQSSVGFLPDGNSLKDTFYRFDFDYYNSKLDNKHDFSPISANESLVELGYKAISTNNNSTFWLGGLYQGDLDCTVVICKSSHEFDWSAGAKFDFTKFSLIGLYKNKKKNDIGFQKFKSGVLKPDASLASIQRGGYQFLGKYEFNQDTILNFSLGDVPIEYSGTDNSEVYRSNYQKSLWTVGVHHDVNSWLKIVAEYNRAQFGINNSSSGKEDSISVGGMLRW